MSSNLFEELISLDDLFLDLSSNSLSNSSRQELTAISPSTIHEMQIAALGGFGNIRKAVYKRQENDFVVVALKFMNKKETEWENELVLKEFNNEMSMIEFCFKNVSTRLAITVW